VDSLTPVTATGITNALGLSAGAYHTCALAGGAVYCWGFGGDGALGGGTATSSNTPVRIQGLSFVALEVGIQESCAIDNGNVVRCWGGNLYGQIGDGTVSSRASPTSVTLPVTANWVSTSGYHTCATGMGRLFCWGENDRGQLGNGDRTAKLSPVI